MPKEILEQLSLVEQVENFFDRIANSIRQWQPEKAQREFFQTNQLRANAGIVLFFDQEEISRFNSGQRTDLIAIREKYDPNLATTQPNVELALYLAATFELAREYDTQDNPTGILAGLEGLKLLTPMAVNQISDKGEKLLLQIRLKDNLEERMRVAIHFEHDFKLAEELGNQLRTMVQNMELVDQNFLLSEPLDMLAIAQYQTQGLEVALKTLESVHPIFAIQWIHHYQATLEILLEEARQQSDQEALNRLEQQARELIAAFSGEGQLKEILAKTKEEIGEKGKEGLSLIKMYAEKILLVAMLGQGENRKTEYSQLKDQLMPSWAALAQNHAFEITDFQAQLLVAEAELLEPAVKLRAYKTAMELFQGIGLGFHVAEVGLRFADCVDNQQEKRRLFLEHWPTLEPLVEAEVMQAFDENPVLPHSPQGKRLVRIIEDIYSQPAKSRPDILHNMLRDVGRQTILQFRRANKEQIESTGATDLFQKLREAFSIEQLIICEGKNETQGIPIQESFGHDQSDLAQNLLAHPQVQGAINDAKDTGLLTQVTDIYGNNQQARHPIRQALCVPEGGNVIITHRGANIVPLTFTQQAALSVAIDEFYGGKRFNGTLEKSMRSMVQTGSTQKGEKKYTEVAQVLNRIYHEIFAQSIVTKPQILVYAGIPFNDLRGEKIIGGLAVNPLNPKETSLAEIFYPEGLWDNIPRNKFAEFGSYGVDPFARTWLSDLLYAEMIRAAQSAGCTNGIMVADVMVLRSFNEKGIKIINVGPADIKKPEVSTSLSELGMSIQDQNLWYDHYFGKFGPTGARVIEIDFKQALFAIEKYQKNF